MLSRRQRHRTTNKRQMKKSYFLVGAVILLLCTLAVVQAFSQDTAVPVAVNKPYPIEQETFTAWPQWQEILFYGVPGLELAAKQQNGTSQFTPASLLSNFFMMLTSVDLRDMRSVINSEIPVVASVKTSKPAVGGERVALFPKAAGKTELDKSKPLVGIYHTHTAESYIPTSGVAHKPGGQTGDIIQVGQALVKQMEKYNIAAIQSTTIHDYPSFMKAYGPSEITAKKMLEDNPSIQMVFDIHRDAQKREYTTAMINGQPVARIMILVAQGQPGLEQPHWQENHAFAKLIDAKLNQHYPGLSRGIQLVEWRYNQHLHPHALLLEVGCQENSVEEAARSMEMLGDVLAEIIAENKFQ